MSQQATKGPDTADVDLELRRLETLKLHHNVQRFFEISPIHGCSYIGFHKAVYEAFFWGLVMCVCTCLCINDLVTLLTKYGSQVTTVSVVFQRNNSVSYPYAAICFDVFRDDLQHSINKAFNETSFNKSLAIVSTFIGNAVGSTGLSTMPATTFTDPNFDIVMKTTYLLLAAIVDYDLGTPGGGNNGYNTSAARAVAIVAEYFTSTGYAYGLLYDQIARYLCNQALLSDIASEPNACAVRDVASSITCIDICGTATVNWLGYTMAFAPFDDICFALNTATSSLFKSALDSIVLDTVYMAHISQLVSEWGQEGQFILPGYGKPHMNFDMRGWRGLMDPRAMDSLCLIGDMTGFLIGVQYKSEFHTFNHSSWGRGTCGSLSFADCALSSCLPAARLAADKCWPLAGFTLNSQNVPPKTPTCSRMYTNDEIANLSNVTGGFMGLWEQCIFKVCTFPPCVQDVFMYETSFSSSASLGSNATLYQSKLSYAVYTELLAMDSGSFLSALGGSMGLWLGSSLISVLHVPVFLVCAFINNLLMRRSSKGTMKGGINTAALAAQLRMADTYAVQQPVGDKANIPASTSSLFL